MKCPQCGTDNPEGCLFCNSCGNSLQERPPINLDDIIVDSSVILLNKQNKKNIHPKESLDQEKNATTSKEPKKSKVTRNHRKDRRNGSWPLRLTIVSAIVSAVFLFIYRLDLMAFLFNDSPSFRDHGFVANTVLPMLWLYIPWGIFNFIAWLIFSSIDIFISKHIRNKHPILKTLLIILVSVIIGLLIYNHYNPGFIKSIPEQINQLITHIVTKKTDDSTHIDEESTIADSENGKPGNSIEQNKDSVHVEKGPIIVEPTDEPNQSDNAQIESSLNNEKKQATSNTVNKSSPVNDEYDESPSLINNEQSIITPLDETSESSKEQTQTSIQIEAEQTSSDSIGNVSENNNKQNTINLFAYRVTRSEGLMLREHSNVKSRGITRVKENEIVIALDGTTIRSGSYNWLKVQTQANETGWIIADFLEPVPLDKDDKE